MPVSPARAAAFDILLRVETQDAYASELLHSSVLDKLSPRDRALATEIVMGVLRWRSRLDEAIAGASSRPLNKLDPEVLTALRIGAYQPNFLTRVPASAAVNESVELIKRARKRSAVPFANAVLRKLASTPAISINETIDLTPGSIAREYAHPPWLVERWTTQFGIERTLQICRSSQHEPAISIRFDDPAAEAELSAEGIELAPGSMLTSARTLPCNTLSDLTRTAAFREGRVAIQDEGSQFVAMLVGTGTRLLDCCAAPGGKTAVLARLNPAAEIIAAELHAHRADLLRNRVHAKNVKIIQADATQLSEGEFDRILADVPCSGTGTLARNPEIKWRLQPEDLDDLHAKQVAILRASLGHLAPGGRAVYSTCSLEPEENEAVVKQVLADFPDFRLLDVRDELERLRASGELSWEGLDSLLSDKHLRTIPGVHPCDGFFAAILERR